MRRAVGIVGVALLLVGAFTLGLLLTRAESAPFAHPLRDEAPSHTLVDEVRAELASGYYRAVDADVLARPSVDDILRGLDDPYTEHLNAAEYASLRSRTARSYSGVGLTVEPAKTGLIVTSARNGPALEAGIRRGDVIVSIDGKPARKLPFERSLSLIKGEDGTLVRLTVRRPGSGKIDFTVVREQLPVPVIHARLVKHRGAKLGYVQLQRFPDGSSARLQKRVDALVARGAKGIVLDLRDNPGGLLPEAVRAASIFVAEGVVCTTEGARQDRRVYEVTEHAQHPKIPLVVLVNRGTASSAEIVAAALREHRRAVLVGERTYGKASVQSVQELSDGSALKLTTSVYLTPSGHNLTGKGVIPRARAVDDPLTPPDEALLRAKKALVRQLTG